MTVGRGVSGYRHGARSRVSIRAVVGACGIAIAVLAVCLWLLQLPTLASPCLVPQCAWPRLSGTGLADLQSLGIAPWGWALIAAGASLAWCTVPLLLGAAVLRSHASPWLAVPWFILALGPLSGVVAEPIVVAILRTATLGAWFTLFALFPSGRFRPRWVAVAPIVACGWTAVLSHPDIRHAEAAGDPVWWTVGAAVYVSCVVLIVAGQIAQFARADDQGRRALRLLLVPLGLSVVFGLGSVLLNARLDADAFGFGTLGGAMLYELSSLLTIVLFGCLAVATLRDEVYDIRIVVDRGLVATVALTIAATVYAVVTLVASLAVSGWLASAIAAVVTAVALASLFGRLVRVIGKLVHGDRDDPGAIAAALDARVAAASMPEQLLPDIAATLAERLRFPGVRITIDETALTPAVDGVLTGAIARVPLTLDDRPLGGIEVALRPGQRRLSVRDRAALAAATGPVAAAAAAGRLNEELRRSRLEVLISRDDERRALRRRLHDEVGPTLALAGHRLTAAKGDPALWDEASRTLADAVAQVRSISRDLRPPALDELGLRAGLAAFAASVSVGAQVTAPERIRPGVIEVAVYRITVEALLNIERHAEASRAVIDVHLDDARWMLDIDDDGRGLAADTAAGVGMLSMRERAEELGGRLWLGRSPLGGVRVHAELPAPREESS